MPELGLTHSLDKQHQDEGPSKNAGSAPQKVGTVSSVQDSPLSSIPRGVSWEDGQATEGIDQADPLSEHKSKGSSDHAARKYILRSEKSVAEDLSLTFDRTSPKPYCRYPSSSQTPPTSYNVLRSSSSYSSVRWDGPRAQGGELPCESSSDGSIHSGANRCARNGAEALLTTPVEAGESENTSRGKDGTLCRSDKQGIENNGRGSYAANAEYLLHAQRSKKPPQDAAEAEYPSKEPIHSASVDYPPSAQKPEDQIKARAPYPSGTATHQPKHQPNTIPTPEDRGIHAAGNGYIHTNTNEPTSPHSPEVVVRTVASSRHKSPYLPSSPLLDLLLSQNPTRHSESSGFWYFYLPSTPTLHGRHSHNNATAAYIQHPIMNTQFHCNQEAAMNSYFHSQNMSNQTPTYPAMNTSAYPVPAMNTSFYPQQYHTHISGFPAMPNFGNQVPATTTNSHPHYFNNAAPQYPAMIPSAYQVPAMHRSAVPQNYNTQYSGYPGLPNYNNQIPAQRMFQGMQNPGLYRMMPTNTTAPANTTGCINPAILSLPHSPSHTSPSPPLPPPQANKPTVIVDLTIDDDAEDASSEQTAEPEMTTLPATTTEAVPTKPKPRPKRRYSWIESSSLLPDIPNAKKMKMSAQEVNLRQQYESRAANSTARFFLGIKPVAPTAGIAAGVPAIDWEKEVAALSTSSSSSVRTSSPKKRARVERKKKDEGVRRKVAGEGAKREVSKGGREEVRGKSREGRNARRKGKEAVEERSEEAEEQEDEEGEDTDLVAAIEAAFDDQEDVDEEGENDALAAAIEAAFEDEEDEQDNDDLAAQIEAAFEGDEEEEQGSRTATDAELEAALANPYLVPVEEEREEWGELVIDENPLAPGEMPKP